MLGSLFRARLGGSGVVISSAISPLIRVIIMVSLPINPTYSSLCSVGTGRLQLEVDALSLRRSQL